ncbi:MAG TPA: hypothetical protein VIG24_19650 [Acidimicrobiia bacterium]
MAISEAARSDLYNGLRNVFGAERAKTLMGAIPLHDFDEVATKADLAILRAELMGEISGLRAELKTDIANLTTEITAEVAALRKQMGNWMLTLMVTIVGAMAGISFLS